MRYPLSVIIILLIGMSTWVTAQKEVDIMLKSSVITEQTGCFDILLRSAHGLDIDIAGQNYRLFYNADKLSFSKDRITYQLDNETYSKIDLINTEDDNIGFVSISIDGKALTKDVVNLSRDGTWKQTLNICFDRLNSESYDITWANAKRTSLFATAEVALSEWVSAESQQVLTPNEVYDYSSLDHMEDLMSTLSLRIYPNPVADYINIEFDQRQQRSALIIKDVIGREVINEDLIDVKNVIYSLADWPEGTYTVVVLDQDGRRLTSQNIIKINN